MLHFTTFDSPVGPLAIAAHDGRVCLLHFDAQERTVRSQLARWYPAEIIEGHPDPAGTATRLRAYFDGHLDALDEIPVEMNGTRFQQEVWSALRRIRTGATSSYGAIARAIGAPSAVRAVGAANGANPIAVIVPCHRVIGSNGSLTGYGGGLERKRWLLQHEGAWAQVLNLY